MQPGSAVGRMGTEKEMIVRMNRRQWSKVRGHRHRGRPLGRMQEVSAILLAQTNRALRKTMRCKHLMEAL
jgi:hypothetical protein